jgi:hypothetical protein
MPTFPMHTLAMDPRLLGVARKEPYVDTGTRVRHEHFGGVAEHRPRSERDRWEGLRRRSGCFHRRDVHDQDGHAAVVQNGVTDAAEEK